MVGTEACVLILSMQLECENKPFMQYRDFHSIHTYIHTYIYWLMLATCNFIDYDLLYCLHVIHEST